nr:S41 family peptidase [Haliovirga abyssi]
MSHIKELREISEVMDLIQTNFVGDKKIDSKVLLHGALKGMVESLDDPHTNYFPPKELNSFTEDIKGEYAGVGMVVSKKDNVLIVVSPIEDTPAYKAGMRPKDKIIAIEKDSTLNLSLEECVKKLKGKAGTTVKITVLREGVEKPFEVKLTRAIIKLKYVKSRMLENKIGYVRLTQFGEHVAPDVRKAVENLRKDGMKGLVFDLRTNPGGALSQAVKIASIFIDEDPIVTVKDKAGRVETYNHEGTAYTDFPMVVLVNGGSASASEIVSGAIKDHKRGILIGEKTYGKGSVQNIVPLPDGDGIKLTIAKYYTPSGVCINGIGINPDIEVKEKYMFFNGFITNIVKEKTEKKSDTKKDVNNVKDTKDTKNAKDTKKKEEKKSDDIQLDTAINVLKGIMFYKK